MLEIGKKIKTLRQQKGWSQAEIAELLKISIPAFSKIESDITDLSMSRLQQIANTFEVPIVDLIATKTEPSQTLLGELQSAKDTIAAQAAKINHLQEYIITLYEQLHKSKQDAVHS
jgi:transcriptional regulator with XRE-family HTH domain